MIALLLAQALDQAPNTWVKRSPLKDTPPSPRLGYEGDCTWIPTHRVMLRYGGHNQGGGGEQHSELWTFDPLTAAWTLKEPNVSPPGVCCEQQNLFDPIHGRYVRFPSFSGSHGWQWFREIYLNDSSVWTYDLKENRWRDLRPYPAWHLAALRCASWDDEFGVMVIFGGENSREGTLVYDPTANEWTKKRPPFEPEGRSGGNMVYDAARKRHILFGAQFDNDPHTWAYDLRANAWTEIETDVTPHADKNDAVLAYDPFEKKVIALVKITEGKDDEARHRLETWTLEGDRWTKMNPPAEPDASGNRARNFMYAPELGLALLENHPKAVREQQVWTYRIGKQEPVAPRKPVPPPIVEDLVVSVISEKQVELSWPPGAGSYVVERADVEVYSEDQLRRLKSKTAPLDSPSVGAIRRVGAFRRLGVTRESAFVDAVEFRPRPIESDPIWQRDQHKENVDPDGKPYRFAVYAYRVRRDEGGPSPAVFTFPSSPQHLFSKEDGLTCRLKWAANPEKGIAGYRVYRMDGRWDKDTITRLGEAPVRGLEFADEGAGKSTRRYYVVAVDAIGQEGRPSSPVWFDREWKPYYAPFTGEWHQ